MKTTFNAPSRNQRGKLTLLAALCAGSVLAACGGGGGGDPAGSVAASQAVQSVPAGSASSPAATLASVIARGPVTALDRLTVNNVRYDDRNATVRIDGHERRLDDLRLGMVVEVEGTRDDSSAVSVARSISASSFAEGRVDAIDRTGRTITVMGVVISVPISTVFEGWSGLDDLSFQPGDFVEVHGLARGPGGGATATRIEKKAPGAAGMEDLSLTGAVTQINTVLKTFMLSGTTVAYANARMENLGAGLAEGMMVRVEGIPSGPGVITASEINGAERQAASVEGYRVEQEGYVNDFTPPAGFTVNGMKVDAAGAMVTGQIADNVRVEVRGLIRNGVLVASSVERKDASNGRVGGEEDKLKGRVAAATADSFQINGLTVRWDANTRFDDVSASTIRNGMQLEVEAIWTGSEYMATRIRPDD